MRLSSQGKTKEAEKLVSDQVIPQVNSPQELLWLAKSADTYGWESVIEPSLRKALDKTEGFDQAYKLLQLLGGRRHEEVLGDVKVPKDFPFQDGISDLSPSYFRAVIDKAEQPQQLEALVSVVGHIAWRASLSNNYESESPRPKDIEDNGGQPQGLAAWFSRLFGGPRSEKPGANVDAFREGRNDSHTKIRSEWQKLEEDLRARRAELKANKVL